MRVAIIGMGTAGVSVLRQLVKHENFSQLKVDVYDDDRNMGQVFHFKMIVANYLLTCHQNP